MSFPVKPGADAVVIDQGQARPIDRWTALHRAAGQVERALQARDEQRPKSSSAMPGTDSVAGRSKQQQASGSSTEQGNKPASELDQRTDTLLRELRALGQRDLDGLKRFLDRHPKLADALASRFEEAALSSYQSGAYADHGLGIPAAEGWA